MLEGVGSLDPEADVEVKIEGIEKLGALAAELEALDKKKIRPEIAESFKRELKDLEGQLLHLGQESVPGVPNVEQRLEAAKAKAPETGPGGAVLFQQRDLDANLSAIRNIE